MTPAEWPVHGLRIAEASSGDEVMLVWFDGQQVEEYHLLVAVGDRVHWTLYPAEREWISQVLGDSRTIEWAFDTEGEAVEQPSRAVTGTVIGLQSVWCHWNQTDQGRVLAAGRTLLRPAADTSRPWVRPLSQAGTDSERDDVTYIYTASHTSAFHDPDAPAFCGYVLSLAMEEE